MTVREMASPAGPGSGEPNLAVAADGRVLLSWIEPAGEGRHALRYASLERSGIVVAADGRSPRAVAGS